jgi:predicted TIM-barrel fold metal-dependent hydrolase
MIIDFRVRPPFKSFLSLALYGPRDESPDPATADGLAIGRPRYRSFEEKSISVFLEEMDEAGIDVAVVMGRYAPRHDGIVRNDDIAELLRAHPRRFAGFGALNVVDVMGALAEVDRCLEMGFKGVALDNPWAEIPLRDDDPRLFPIYEKCERLGLLVAITSSIYLGADLSYCMPVHVQRVAERFPGLKILVVHAAWPWVLPICGVALKCTNVYLVPDFYGYLPDIPGAEHYVHAANSYLSYRMLYASSYPVRPLRMSLEQFRALPFRSPAVLSRCVGQNGARLLGIT